MWLIFLGEIEGMGEIDGIMACNLVIAKKWVCQFSIYRIIFNYRDHLGRDNEFMRFQLLNFSLEGN